MLEWVAATFLGALSFEPSSTPELELEWSAPASCPAGSVVRQQLARALANHAADSRGVRVRATVTEGGSGLALELWIERDGEPAGHRSMQAHDCQELAKAAVLIIALTVDPEATLDDEAPIVAPPPALPPEPSPEPPAAEVPDAPVPPRLDTADDPLRPPPADGRGEPAAPAAPGDPPPAVARPETTPNRPDEGAGEGANEGAAAAAREPVALGLRVDAAAGLAVLSRPTAVVSLAATVARRAWRAELGVSYWTPVESIPSGSSSGGRLQQWTVDARGCGRLRPGPLVIPLCAGVDLGAVHGRGIGVLSPQRVVSLRAAATAGVALIWRPADRFGLRIGGDVLFALARARFRATPSAPGLVYYTPPVGGRVGAGIEVRFR